MERRDDNHFIAEVLAGNTAAYSALVNRHKDLVFSIVLKIVQNREDAEEVAQDTFVKAFQKLSSFRKDSKFSTWLYRIAFNEAVSRTRLKRLPEVDFIDDISEPAAEEEVEENVLGLDPSEQQQAVSQALKKLPPEDQLLVDLFYREGLPVGEISGITGLSDSNVKVRLHRLRKKIYIELNEILMRRAHSF